MSSHTPLPMGSTIGILGGGQLGRMLALAAARLGMKTHIYCPDATSPAFDVTPAELITGFVTDAGILRPPFGAAIAAALVGGGAAGAATQEGDAA